MSGEGPLSGSLSPGRATGRREAGMLPDTVGGRRARPGEGGGALRGSSRPARYVPPHPAGQGAQVGAAATLPGRVTQQPPLQAGREAHSFPTR